MKVTISEIDGTTRVEVDPGGSIKTGSPLDNLVRLGWTVGYDSALAYGLRYWAKRGETMFVADTPEALRTKCVWGEGPDTAEEDPAS